MAIVLYCVSCQTNHVIRPRDVEDVIHSLIADLATEEAEGNVFSNPVDTGSADVRLREMCIVENLQTWRDPEMYAEHLESMREARLHRQRQLDYLRSVAQAETT